MKKLDLKNPDINPIAKDFIDSYKIGFNSLFLILQNRRLKNPNPQLIFLEQKIQLIDPEFSYLIIKNNCNQIPFPLLAKRHQRKHQIILRQNFYNGAVNHLILCNLYLYLIIISYLSFFMSGNFLV